MSKYDALTEHLEKLEANRWDATFEEIEGILGFQLPLSAREHAAWWANQTTGQRVQCSSWMDVGWSTAGLDIAAETVSFLKSKEVTASNTEQLAVEPEAMTLAELVEYSKQRIAALAGVPISNVAITIAY
ncbi:hypothetical protein [Rhodovulum sp. FJ3]|uniref:DUF7662 domain-containing protein n=1 Tax=Rhodovulum sp. FJ3 TaxID=3079053 RepID=UPI00293DC7C6|nr:hypothetical protein [Rhodovulum sp. FJ3]MDV4167414.1 hypothetical protein [Rhodovulum sp. FJ3]